jgi:lipoprotein-releasing system permease protein
LNVSFYIARHFRPKAPIAMLGVALGIAVMIISVCVVTGFKHTIRDKVIGFSSDIVVTNYMTLHTLDQSNPINADNKLIKDIKKTEGVERVQRYSQKQGVLKTNDDFLGVMFKGVGEDYDTTFLASNLIEGKMPRLSMYKSTQQLLISKNMADKLRLKVGKKVFVYFLSDDEVRARPFNITGIYQTNFARYDDIMCFTDLYTISRLNGWKIDEENTQVTGCELQVVDFDSLNVVAERVAKKFDNIQDSQMHNLASCTVYDMSPQTFAWLDLLDLNVWIILILMVCVAGFTIVSGLLIIILERTSTIGLLKALGARNSTIRKTFRWLALGIVVKGMVWGNIIGIGICLLQEKFGIVKLDPTAYYVSEAPVEMNWIIILLLNIVTLIITIAVLVIPSFFIGTVRPAKTMRME